MNSPALGLRLASVIFGLICLGHVIRILAHINVVVAGESIGRRWSAIAAVLLAALCGWLWSLASRAKAAEGPVPPAA